MLNILISPIDVCEIQQTFVIGMSTPCANAEAGHVSYLRGLLIWLKNCENQTAA